MKNKESNEVTEVTKKETQPNSNENINQPNTNENSAEQIEHSLTVTKKETQPNSNENINQPNTNENSAEQIERSLTALGKDEENGFKNVTNDEYYKSNKEGKFYSMIDKIDNKNVMNNLKQKKYEDENKVSKNIFDNKNMMNLDDINLKQKICEDENEVRKNYSGNKNMMNWDEINLKQKICGDEFCKNFLGNKRSNVNLIESIKNNFCGGSNSKEGDSCSNSNCIPLIENWGYDNSEYNNDISNFLPFENQSSNSSHGEINFSSHSLEEINVNHDSELFSSQEAHISDFTTLQETQISELSNIHQNSEFISSQETHISEQSNVNQNSELIPSQETHVSEQNGVRQSSELITSQETHISEFTTSLETYNLQQYNINQNLQHSENNTNFQIENIHLFKLSYNFIASKENLDLDNNNNYNEAEDSNINLNVSKNNLYLDNNNNCNEKKDNKFFLKCLNNNLFDSESNINLNNNN